MKNHIFPFLWMRGEPEETIREEIKAIAHCGIQAVCLEARPHPDYCGDGWWHDVDIVIDEAKKRDMKIWILDDAHFPTGFANGLIEKKYPDRRKLYINYNSSDVIAHGDKISLNVMQMLQPKISFLDIGKPVDIEEVKRNRLLALVAARMGSGNNITNEVADLTDKVQDGWLHYELPKGIWRIYAVFTTRLGGGRENYINMLDEESVSTLIEAVYEPHYRRYKEYFGTILAGFFSDEPEMGNVGGYGNDERIGHKEMPLPWSSQMPEEMEGHFGKNWRQALPFLWNGSEDKKAEAEARLGYMNIITRRYQKCFAKQIGTWCEEHGVEHIGHVVEDNDQHTKLGAGNGHYFRSISGQHMAGVDVIRNQILPGAGEASRQLLGISDSAFYHYVLAKMGSSAAAIDPKKKGRTMCELFGAYDWNLGVRDMSWILNHLLVRGVNELVPHAFSMKEYPDFDCPPHFYAGGNNPQFEDFAELMKYANRMCEVIQEGRHIADAGLLYQCEGEWMGEYMPVSAAAKILTQTQVDFDILPADVFTDSKEYQTEQSDQCFSVNGSCYRTIFIPYMEVMPEVLAEAVISHTEVAFVFISDYPAFVTGSRGCQLLEEIKKNSICVKPDDLSGYCREQHISAVSISENVKELVYYHYRKQGDRYLFFNESLEQTYTARITMQGNGELLSYDGWTDTYERVQVDTDGETITFDLNIAPYELKAYFLNPVMEAEAKIEEKAECPKVRQQDLNLSKDWEVSLSRAIDYPNFTPLKRMDELVPVSDLEKDFSGIIRYEKKIVLEEDAQYLILRLEKVYECARVYLDGSPAGFKVMPPYDIRLNTGAGKGEHILTVEVSTTLVREQMKYPAPPFCLVFSALEPTGMYGTVTLSVYGKEG